MAEISNKPCSPGNDVRSSELCAQWMAVDASRQQAIAANRAVDLSTSSLVLSLLTLIAAIYAALQAKRAALAAIRQANEAAISAKQQKESNERQHALQAQQNRASLFVQDAPVLMLPRNGQTNFSFKIINNGNSLASDLQIETRLICHQPDSDSAVSSNLAQETLPSILPGISRPVDVPIDYDREAVVGFGNTWFAVEMVIEICWRDAFGYLVRERWRCDGSSCIEAMPSPLTPHLLDQSVLICRSRRDIP